MVIPVVDPLLAARPARPARPAVISARRRPVLKVEEETLFQQAYARIEEMIATLVLSPGQVVSESMLAAHLGLGRTPVREALQQLSREGMVLVMPRRGIVVAEIDVRKQLRLLEYRRCIEHGMVSFASRRATDTQRTGMVELARRMDAAHDDDVQFLALDRDLNQLLLEAARNEYIASAMRMIQGSSRRFWFANERRHETLPETVRLHSRLARAVAGRDEVRAVAALNDLLDNIEAFTRATLDH